MGENKRFTIDVENHNHENAFFYGDEFICYEDDYDSILDKLNEYESRINEYKEIISYFREKTNDLNKSIAKLEDINNKLINREIIEKLKNENNKLLHELIDNKSLVMMLGETTLSGRVDSIIYNRYSFKDEEEYYNALNEIKDELWEFYNKRSDY